MYVALHLCGVGLAATICDHRDITGASHYTDECADLEAHRLLKENPSVKRKMAPCALLVRETLEASDTGQATALILRCLLGVGDKTTFFEDTTCFSCGTKRGQT